MPVKTVVDHKISTTAGTHRQYLSRLRIAYLLLYSISHTFVIADTYKLLDRPKKPIGWNTIAFENTYYFRGCQHFYLMHIRQMIKIDNYQEKVDQDQHFQGVSTVILRDQDIRDLSKRT